MVKNNTIKFQGKGKWHVRTKHSNAIIWSTRNIHFSVFTFQRILLFIKLSETNGGELFQATMRKGGSKFPPDWIQFSFGKIKGLNSLRDGQGKMWLTFFLLKSSHFAFELQGSSLFNSLSFGSASNWLKKKKKMHHREWTPVSLHFLVKEYFIIANYCMLYCFRIMNECVCNRDVQHTHKCLDDLYLGWWSVKR